MKSKAGKQFLTTIIIVFILQSFLISYIFISFYQSSTKLITELGVSSLDSQASMIENYLAKGRNVLWFAAESVDYLQKTGADKKEITDYLTEETNQMQSQFDKYFTGIYGYLDGSYVDGSGWVPPEGYDPTQRDWYIQAVEADGLMICSAPYVDAQTGEIVLSFSQLLSDKKSVISVDIVLEEVQNNTEKMSFNGLGYGFIMNNDGLIVAHSDKSERGKNYSSERDSEDKVELYKKVRSISKNEFEMEFDNEACTIFKDEIEEGWYVIIVVSNTKLFHDLRNQIIVGAVIAVFIFVVILIFCILSLKRIMKAEKKEMQTHEKLEQVSLNVIRSLASAIDAKDRYTSGHSHRVAEYSKAIAKRMGKSEEDQRIIYIAGLLHDVGKIRVPESVINKNGRLTDDEFNQIRIHPVSGFHILKDIHEDVRVGYGAKYHHERYDGKGYPNGLEGTNIPEVARIIGVADAYDAMTSDRSYRDALPKEIVRKEIEKGKGSQFDPEIADVMLNMMDEDYNYKLRQKENDYKKILVIDDDIMNEKIVRHALRDLRFMRVLGARNEEETMRILEKDDIDLIILDLVMPDVDGFSLYEKINEDYDIPVVLMTSDRSEETLKRIRELNIDDYLTKPMNAFVLKETVHGVLHGGVYENLSKNM